jgi:hypothetical protein
MSADHTKLKAQTTAISLDINNLIRSSKDRIDQISSKVDSFSALEERVEHLANETQSMQT